MGEIESCFTEKIFSSFHLRNFGQKALLKAKVAAKKSTISFSMSGSGPGLYTASKNNNRDQLEHQGDLWGSEWTDISSCVAEVSIAAECY